MDYVKLSESANNIENAIRDNAALKSVIADNSQSEGCEECQYNPITQKYITSATDSGDSIAIKKAYAAAMIIAREKGVIDDVPTNSSEIAAVADEGVSRVKDGYQVGMGMIEAEDAIDKMVDRAEARVVACINHAFDFGEITNKLVEKAYSIPVVGQIIGPIGKGYKPIVDHAVNSITAPVKESVLQGVSTISGHAKMIANRIVVEATSLAVSICKTILCLFF